MTFRTGLGLAVVAAGVLSLPEPARGHEIPPFVTVQAIAHPQGDRLRLLVRVPLEAMRDFDFPVRGPGYLDLGQLEPWLVAAAELWLVDYLELWEGSERLTRPEVTRVRISLPSDRSFTGWNEALAHVTGPRLPEDTELFWTHALLDVLLEVPISSPASDFSMRAGWAHLGQRTTTVIRYRTQDGEERVLQYAGAPGLVRLDPRWHQAALSFVRLGFHHILEGIDHLLFVLCLVIPFRRFWPLVALVTSFTLAHSVTLGASVLGFSPQALWFPPLVETLIALSIVYMALENILGPSLRRRWVVTFGFGLVHGFGFSFALQDSLQFGGAHLLTSLLAFNVGVELGQILVLVLALPLLGVLFRRTAERPLVIVLSALVAHTAWHWAADYAAELREHAFQWPAFDLVFLAAAMRWLALALVLAGLLWATSAVAVRAEREQRARDPEGVAAGVEG